MSNRLMTIDRFIIVRTGATETRVPITNCFWCSTKDNAICALCHTRAESVRALTQDEHANG